ncbi:hypothetical protein [Liberiplasma polymorphum]|uniref:hypothetical protein n=1 Tax=Liberiplasma polymorphum TaxID=3374570 RepID=UPI003772F471
MDAPIEAFILKAINDSNLLKESPADTILDGHIVEAHLFAKSSGVITGVQMIKMIYEQMDKRIYFKAIQYDGALVEENDMIAIISGPLNRIIKGETMCLNLMKRLSCLSTTISNYLELLTPSNIKLYVAFNSFSNINPLEKYAVQVAGGSLLNEKDSVNIHLNFLNTIKRLADASNESINSLNSMKTPFTVEVNSVDAFRLAQLLKPAHIKLMSMDYEFIDTCSKLNNTFIPLVVSVPIQYEAIKTLSTLPINALIIEQVPIDLQAFDLAIIYQN